MGMSFLPAAVLGPFSIAFPPADEMTLRILIMPASKSTFSHLRPMASSFLSPAPRPSLIAA